MESYQEVYLRAKRLLEEESDKLLPELDRVLAAADRDLGERLESTVRLTEMALVAKLDPWWTGPPQGNIRAAIGKLHKNLQDRIALGLGLRLAIGYGRLGRVDDEAHRLMVLADRLASTELPHPDASFAEEAQGYLERVLFLPSATYAYQLVKDLPPSEAREVARTELSRKNPSFAALLCEMRLVRALDDWYVGPPLSNVESALTTYAAERPPELQELAVLLARAYVEGAFVDLRARHHVLAIVRGDEAKLLGPAEAIGFQDYVDRECFDYPYEHLYEQAKGSSADELRAAIRKFTQNGSITAAQRLSEMALVRRLDDWYMGNPAANVRGAITRYLASEPAADPDADWCASHLGGLYAATLEDAAPARKLVHALVERGADDEFREAMHAAGIPADVTVEELHLLYKDSVELEARIEAFKALAVESGGLSDYEQRAYGEVLEYLERGDSSLLGDMAQTLGALVENVASDALVRSGTAVVEDVLRLAVSGAKATLRRDRILGQLARRDPNLRSLEKIRTADLALLDEVAWSITLENRVVATLEGLGCGLGGPTLVLIDLPMLILVNLNAVAAVATTYGFDVDVPAERDFMIGLLAGGVTALQQVVAQEDGGAAAASPLARVGGEHLAGNRAALALHAAAAKIATRLARQKMLQLLPILGGAVGAGLNFQFTHATSRAAVMAYRYRWLLRRFLDHG